LVGQQWCGRISQTYLASSVVGFYRQITGLCCRYGSLWRREPSWSVLPATWSRTAADVTTLRQAHVKVHKDDDRDAEAIAEAATRPTMPFVAIKSEEKFYLQALHVSAKGSCTTGPA